MVTNTEARATAKQLWYLHLLTKTDTRESKLSFDEVSILIDYYKGQQAIKKLQNGHSYLCEELGIDFTTAPSSTQVTANPASIIKVAEKIVKKHKAKTQADIDFPWIKSGRNKRGGGNCKISVSPVTLESSMRSYARCVAAGITSPYKSEQAIPTCPTCRERVHFMSKRGPGDNAYTCNANHLTDCPTWIPVN